ncbi:MAG: hypothetical protein EOO48_01655 [Flavobacterium sp.]|nr:MAG: hypothetical protein EOO48_01655 [Flavobacterium sp.]
MRFFIIVLLLPVIASGQSDIETAIRGGQILLTSLTALKMAKDDPYAKTVESVCIKNKLEDKITFTFSGKDDDGEDIVKELVIAKSDKECLYKLPKGIYTYVITLSDGTVYKKGEYKLENGDTITIKGD